MSDPLNEFLRACARVTLDADDRARLIEAAARVDNWADLPGEAEYHGLTPIVWHHAQETGIATSAVEWRQLGALVLRRRDQSREQAEALGEIVDALDAAGIENLILKGAILAHVLYPRPDLRPMGDLDILVAPAEGGRAQALLTRLGFHAPAAHARATQRLHHHLPIATRCRNGIVVNVEIHRDALSRDQPGRLRLDPRLQRREVVVAGRRLRTFGHADMLTHLCAHVLEPADRTRLIAVADFVGYAARYAAEIDWEMLRARQPRVVNALALMHYITPLPAPVGALRPPKLATPPSGVGRGLTPLSLLAVPGRGARKIVQTLLYPPEWWMRGYYTVPPGQPLFPVRWGRHLWRIMRWGWRRVLSASKT